MGTPRFWISGWPRSPRRRVSSIEPGCYRGGDAGGQHLYCKTKASHQPRDHARHRGLHVARAGAGVKNLDARTDLFSFGVVLYEMATGQVAFLTDRRLGATFGAILHENVLPASHWNRDGLPPPQLEEIIWQGITEGS